jgi:hypothetical protein
MLECLVTLVLFLTDFWDSVWRYLVGFPIALGHSHRLHIRRWQ